MSDEQLIEEKNLLHDYNHRDFMTYYLSSLLASITTGVLIAVSINTREPVFIALMLVSATATIVSSIFSLRHKFNK